MSLYLSGRRRRFACFLTGFWRQMRIAFIYISCMFMPSIPQPREKAASKSSVLWFMAGNRFAVLGEGRRKFLSKADGLFIVCHGGLARLLKMLRRRLLGKSFSWNVVFVFTISFHDIFARSKLVLMMQFEVLSVSLNSNSSYTPTMLINWNYVSKSH